MLLQHVAKAINEEVDLQIRLLDNLEEEVDVVHSRMGAAGKRLKMIMSKSSDWRCWCVVAVLAIALIGLLVYAFKALIFN